MLFQNASFVLLAVFLWFVGCVWQYLTTDKIGGVAGVRGTSSGINFYLLADLLINFVAALNHLGNPAATFDWFIVSYCLMMVTVINDYYLKQTLHTIYISKQS
jgi:hypothetical protein